MKIPAFIILLVLLASVGIASASTYQFVGIGGSGYDVFYDVAVYGDYVYVVGDTNWDPIIVKLDKEGRVIWKKKFDIGDKAVFKGVALKRW